MGEFMRDQATNADGDKDIIARIEQILSTEGFAILDNNKKEKPGSSYVFSNPIAWCAANNADEVEARLAELESYTRAGYYAAGYFSYELGYVMHQRLHSRLPQNRKFPLFNIGIYRDRLEVTDAALDMALTTCTANADVSIINCHLNMEKEKYLDRVNKVQRHIYDGDTYQINFTLKYKFQHAGSPLKLYCELRRRQRVEYGAFLNFPELTILSRSPELFFNKREGDIYTKPMKGTCKRGETPEQDAVNFQFLSTDEKSRAENVMIVDLLRNDLSRISERGSVRTTGLFEVQTYETLHQMVSTVSAKVNPEISLTRLLREIFPCGSITGAPKMRTMELIQDLEMEPRGVYTGAIGYITPDQSICLNVPIRTLALWPNGEGEMGVGSGVVHDSDPGAEYDECRLKGQFFTRGFSEFELIESLLFDGSYRNLDKHLARLANSCRELGFRLELQQLKRDLLASADRIANPAKVRVVVHRNGEYAISETPIVNGNTQPKKIIVAPTRIQSKQNWLLRHKTSRRALYEEMFERYRPHGYYDVVFQNEKDELTEGTFNNLFIRKGKYWYTPPVACGALPGIQRQCLLESNEISAREKILSLDDLRDADEIYLTNAVRGVVRVELDPSGGDVDAVVNR